MPKRAHKPLWRCPKCGAKLVTPNMWHSCGKFSLAVLFSRSEPQVLPLFRKFTALVRKCGAVTMIPQKTRAVFMGHVRFASAYPRKNISSPALSSDAALLDWLRESYHFYGQQERLQEKRRPAPRS